MSLHLEAVKGLIERWNAGDRDVPADLDPAVELESPFSEVSGEPYRGYDGIREWARAIDEQFSEWRIRIDEMREVERKVLQIGAAHLRGRTSGVELDQPFALVAEFGTDHRITRVRIYTDIDAARRAMGLDE
jgi:ketosteroid isomerase-like protein